MRFNKKDPLHDAYRSMYLSEEVEKDDVNEMKDDEEEVSEEHLEEKKGDGRNMNRLGTTLGGAAIGGTLGGMAGGLTGAAGTAAAGITDIDRANAVIRGASALGNVAGSVAGGVKGWKHATKQNKAMYGEENSEEYVDESDEDLEEEWIFEDVDADEDLAEELDPAVKAELHAALAPIAAKLDSIDAEVAEDDLQEAEKGRRKANLLKKAALVGAGIAAAGGAGVAAHRGVFGNEAQNVVKGAMGKVQDYVGKIPGLGQGNN